MNLKGWYSRETDNWETPKSIYNWFVRELGYYDPCPLNATEDGLSKEWEQKTLLIHLIAS